MIKLALSRRWGRGDIYGSGNFSLEEKKEEGFFKEFSLSNHCSGNIVNQNAERVDKSKRKAWSQNRKRRKTKEVLVPAA